jgi:RNase P/RNase MRP subunit p30
MKFYDLNISKPLLAEKEKLLGFDRVATFAVIEGDERKVVSDCKKKNFALVSPFGVKKFYENKLLMKSVVEGNKCFEIPISMFLRVDGVERARLMNRVRLFLKFCLRKKACFVFTSRALEESELKTPREWIAIGVVLGLDYRQSEYAFSGRIEKLGVLT